MSQIVIMSSMSRVPRRVHREVAFLPLAGTPLATGLTFLAVVDEAVLPGVDFPLRIDHHLLVCQTLSGRAEILGGEPGHEHRRGRLVVIAPGMRYTHRVVGTSPWHARYALLGGPWVAQMPVSGIRSDDHPPLATLAALERLVDAGLQQPSNWAWTALAAIGAMAVHFAAQVQLPPGATVVEAVGRLVDGDPAEPWRLDRLGALFNCSPREFDRRFRSETGEGPASWIRRRRMEHARRWLAIGRSPSAIAEELGYAGLSQFSRAFKATVGVYPSRWR